MEKLHNKFVIIIPNYNVENLIEASIRSVVAQNFVDVGIIIRDDMSTDRTPEVLEGMLKINGREEKRTNYLGRDILYFRNSRKFYVAGNTYDSVVNHVDNPEAIIGVLDGDDMLMDLSALDKIYRVYQEKKVWQVWTQHQAISKIQDKTSGWSSALPCDEEIYAHRNYWAVSHFRTCKAWLFNYLNPEDLKDPFQNSPYCQYAGDASLTYALTELCANEKSYFLDEVLYLYNDNLPLNDHNIALETQKKYADYLRNYQQKYKKIKHVDLAELKIVLSDR